LLGQQRHSEQNNRLEKSARNHNDRKVRPQVVKAVEPRAAKVRVVEPRAAKPKAAKVRAVEPRAVEPRVAHKVVEPRDVELKVGSGCRVCLSSKLWMLIKMVKSLQKKSPMPWPL
jgi:hypothetical protein